MMRITGRRTAVVALAAGLMGTGACAPLGAMGGGMGGGVMLASGGGVLGAGSRVAVVEGQIRSVDTRRSRIQLRDQRNRSYYVYVDRWTQVIYRQRSYPVSALERGDIVRVRITHDRGGAPWASRIDVRESVRDRGVVAVRPERLTGAVTSVDIRRGHFTMQIDRRRSVAVHMPPRLSRTDVRRFEQLRRGDRVRIEVMPTARGLLELVRFH